MKRVAFALLAVVLVALSYYLFFRPYEFEVNFKSTTTPGDIIETIRIWDRSLENAEIVAVDSFSRLDQTIGWDGHNYLYHWNFEMISDSVTQVNIQISEPGNWLMNKLLVPVANQPIEIHASEIGKGFYHVLKTHLEITRVEVKGLTQLDSSFCVCTALETSQVGKANGMMKDFMLLSSFIDKFKLKSAGPPAVRIREWSHNAGSLKFDFCFPIARGDTLPIVDSLFYKKFDKQLTLQAEFRGNYITSDRAWYALIQYAQKNNYKITGFPIEYFHDNPNLGLSERNWKADVYLPVAD